MSRERLRILFAVSEIAPFAQTGGLADVAQSLPQALARAGHDVRVWVPKYRGVERFGALAPVTPRLPVPIGDATVEGAVVEGRLGTVPVYFLAHDRYFDRPTLYAGPEGDYPDNCERFVFFCRGALEALRGLSWIPHVVHANDWQTGLLPVYLETLYRDDPAYREIGTLFAVHNIAYQGVFAPYELPLTGLGWDLFTPAGIEFYGDLSLLKGGLVFADLLTTVSPTYAREIQTPEYGERLDGVLRERSADLVGILNGIDPEVWDPATDSEIAKPFGLGDVEGKRVCKKTLREELGLAEGEGSAPLVGMVSRLTDQKGLELVQAVVPRLLDAGAQFVVLGSGDPRIEGDLEAVARARPDAVAVRIGFDEPLARRIYAAADLYLMPSRFEPCGLGQLIALRYGGIPVVRRTGGLTDTVSEWDPATGTGNGIVFDAYTPEACADAVERALRIYARPAEWRRLVRNAMIGDHSWEASAEQYVACYRRAVKKARRHA